VIVSGPIRTIKSLFVSDKLQCIAGKDVERRRCVRSGGYYPRIFLEVLRNTINDSGISDISPEHKSTAGLGTTPWYTVLLDKLLVSQLNNKFSAF
jgi:hypothetical protein